MWVVSEDSENLTPDESQRVQRRDSFRVDLLLAAVVEMRGSEPDIVDIVDLSGSGCSFPLRVEPALGSRGTVRLDMVRTASDGPLVAPFTVRVVRADDGIFLVGVEFTLLAPADRERIVKAVFAQQRRQLRRTRTGVDAARPARPIDGAT